VARVRGEEQALDQMRLANRLWNLLVAIDRAHKRGYLRLMRDAAEERIEELVGQARALRGEIKARRKVARKRAVEVEDLVNPLRAIKAELSTLISARRMSSPTRHAAKRAELAALQERRRHRIKRAWQAASACGLFWGTYNDIVQRAETGRRHGGELGFRSFRGEGTVTAQIIGGVPVQSCVGASHRFFQLGAQTDGQKWRYARMRIGSNENRSPIWLEIPIVYHRDLPLAGTIKSVSMTRRMVAGNPRWQLNIVVNTPAIAVRGGDSAIAIDIGWRLLPEGVRVGYWLDDSGAHSQLLVPAADIGEFEKIRSLRSTVDRLRDKFQPRLVEWLHGVVLPAEWSQRSAHLDLWRSPDRLADLILWWREHRLPEDEGPWLEAQQWRAKYLHLARWRRNLQDQMTRRVRERYRIFAAQVSRKYATVYLEAFDLRTVIEKPAAELGAHLRTSSAYRHLVSPSTLRSTLLNALNREGVRIVKLPGEYTTLRCHVCARMRLLETPSRWDRVKSIVYRCERGHLWDQDYNAAANLLALGREPKVI
jgi:hypothetical protein